MKLFIITVLLVALLAVTPARAEERGPSLTLENVYQTLGPCVGLPQVRGPIINTCGRTLIIKAGGTP